jgi:Arc/MetJ-type ribon-helix-helix transcriptional regulator
MSEQIVKAVKQGKAKTSSELIRAALQEFLKPA